MGQVAQRRPGHASDWYLALAGVCSALIYAAILVRLPLVSIYSRPLLNLNSIPVSDWSTGLALLGCVAFLFGAYAIGARSAMGTPRRLTALLILAFPLLFTTLLVFTHPMSSTDVYDYLFRGRMLARYQANPFVQVPWDFRSDALIKYVAWKQAVTSYGPMWEGLSWIALRLAGESPAAPNAAAPAQLLTMIFAYKILAALGFLFCGAAIWWVAGRVAPAQRWLGVYIWLWNPLALWETVGAAHNDVWMAVFIVLAAGALGVKRGDKETATQAEQANYAPHLLRLFRQTLALLALIVGGLIKYVAFFFGPVALAAALRRIDGWRGRLGLVAIGGAACLGLVAIAYAPFWEGLATLQNVRDRRSLYTSSWLGTARVVLKGAMPEPRAEAIVAAASLALLLAGVIWATYSAWSEPDDTGRHMLWLSLWFVFVCNPWFQPWYAIWPLALAAAQPWRVRAVIGTAVLCATALASYVVGGLVLPALGMPDKSLGREFWMAAFITLPPLLVVGWPQLSSAGRAARRLPQSIAARRQRPVKSGHSS
jgi:alpha-1,6-mannosyltransferase